MASDRRAIAELVERARRASEPPADASERMRRAVLTGIGATVAGSAAITGVALAKPAWWGAFAKWIGVIVVSTTATVVVATAVDRGADPTITAAPSPAAVEAAEAQTTSHPTVSPVLEGPPAELTATAPPVANVSPSSARALPPARRNTSPSPAVAPTALRDEIAALATVNDARSRGDRAAARRALVDYQRRFPDGQMRSEAMVLDIVLTAAAGEDVGQACARFSAAYPRSVHDERIVASCSASR